MLPGSVAPRHIAPPRLSVARYSPHARQNPARPKAAKSWDKGETLVPNPCANDDSDMPGLFPWLPRRGAMTKNGTRDFIPCPVPRVKPLVGFGAKPHNPSSQHRAQTTIATCRGCFLGYRAGVRWQRNGSRDFIPCPVPRVKPLVGFGVKPRNRISQPSAPAKAFFSGASGFYNVFTKSSSDACSGQSSTPASRYASLR